MEDVRSAASQPLRLRRGSLAQSSKELGLVSSGRNNRGGRQPTKQEMVNTLHDFAVTCARWVPVRYSSSTRRRICALPIFEQVHPVELRVRQGQAAADLSHQAARSGAAAGRRSCSSIKRLPPVSAEAAERRGKRRTSRIAWPWPVPRRAWSSRQRPPPGARLHRKGSRD